MLHLPTPCLAFPHLVIGSEWYHRCSAFAGSCGWLCGSILGFEVLLLLLHFVVPWKRPCNGVLVLDQAGAAAAVHASNALMWQAVLRPSQHGAWAKKSVTLAAHRVQCTCHACAMRQKMTSAMLASASVLVWTQLFFRSSEQCFRTQLPMHRTFLQL